jgi:hypothetical protein
MYNSLDTSIEHELFLKTFLLSRFSNFFNKEPVLFSFSSINSAVVALGISRVVLVRYLSPLPRRGGANLKNYSLYSPILQKIFCN